VLGARELCGASLFGFGFLDKKMEEDGANFNQQNMLKTKF
jgi:hypothetical protein